MTLVALPAPIVWPGINVVNSGAPTLQAATLLDAAGEYSAMVFNAKQAMAITHVGFYVQGAVGSPTAEVRIETLTSGNPSGTLFATNTNGTSGTLTASTWALVALTATANITAGQDFAVLVQYASGTSTTLSSLTASTFGLISAFPYRVTNTTGSAVKSNGQNLQIALGSSTTTFYPLTSCYPVLSSGGGTFNNTNGAVRAARFQVPFTCRAIGMRVFLGPSVGNFNIVLFDDAGSELSSSSTAKVGANLKGSGETVESFFDNPVTLAIGTWYRAGLEPSSATNSQINFVVLPSADYRSAMPGGTNYHYATRASGVWTDTATDTVPLIDIIIDQLDNGATTGGGVSRSRAFGGFG